MDAAQCVTTQQFFTLLGHLTNWPVLLLNQNCVLPIPYTDYVQPSYESEIHETTRHAGRPPYKSMSVRSWHYGFFPRMQITAIFVLPPLITCTCRTSVLIFGRRHALVACVIEVFRIFEMSPPHVSDWMWWSWFHHTECWEISRSQTRYTECFEKHSSSMTQNWQVLTHSDCFCILYSIFVSFK